MTINVGNTKGIALAVGQILTLTASADAVGAVIDISTPGSDPVNLAAIAGANLVLGPYTTTKLLQVSVSVGSVTDVVSTPQLEALAFLKALDLKTAVIAGGAAGDHTVTGIKTTDTLVSVIRAIGAGVAVTDIADLTSEFTASVADTINNTAGTNTTGDKLLVIYKRMS